MYDVLTYFDLVRISTWGVVWVAKMSLIVMMKVHEKLTI